jgi:hypothetical protein
MDRAGVPEASIDEYGETSTGERNIGAYDSSRNSERQVFSEPQAAPM